MDTENPTHPILQDIEAYCASRGIKPCQFGQMAMGDPSLVASLRRGRDPRSRTVAAIKHFMITGAAAPRRARQPRRAQ